MLVVTGEDVGEEDVESRRLKGARKTAGVLHAGAVAPNPLDPAMDTWRGTLRHDRLTDVVVDHGSADGANAGSVLATGVIWLASAPCSRFNVGCVNPECPWP